MLHIGRRSAGGPRQSLPVPAVPRLPRWTSDPELSTPRVSLLQVVARALNNFLYLVDSRLQQKLMKMVRVKITVMKKIRTCTVSVRSSYGTVGIECLRYRYTWLTIRPPQIVGCDDEDCPYQ